MIKVDLTINSEVLRYINIWLMQRNLNREFYQTVPHEKFSLSFKMGSPSTLDNLIYQIKVHDNYFKCMQEGELIHGKHYRELQLDELNKDSLLEIFDEIDQKILGLVSSKFSMTVKVPWNKEPVPVATVLLGLKDHEIYHIGRNVLMGELLGIPRSESMKKVWG